MSNAGSSSSCAPVEVFFLDRTNAIGGLGVGAHDALLDATPVDGARIEGEENTPG